MVDADVVAVDVFVNLSDDNLDAFKHKRDRPKNEFVSKLAMISFREWAAETDNCLDRELIPRLVLVVSLEEAHKEEDIPDGGGV